MRIIRIATTIAGLFGMLYCVGLAQWVQTSGPPGGGWITGIAQLRDTLYAVNYQSGLWESADHGISWHHLETPSLAPLSCLLSTGSALIVGGSSQEEVFESDEPSQRWTILGDLSPYTSYAVSELFADTTGVYAAASTGLYYYSDSISAWTLILNNGSSAAVISFYEDGGILYAGTAGGGVRYSTDRGSTWLKSDSGAISPSWPNVFTSSGDSLLFAGTTEGVFLSSDSGKSWTHVAPGVIKGIVRALANCGGCVAAGSDSGVFISTDNGATWQKRVHGMKDLYVSSLFWKDGTLVCGTGDWIYTSADSGMDWTLSVGGPNSAYIEALGFHNGILFSSVQDERTYGSTDDGDHWIPVWGIPDSTSVTGFMTSRSRFYASTDNGLFQLNDSDTTWMSIDTASVLRGYYSFISLNDTDLFTGTFYEIHRSTDGGVDWTPADSGLPPSPMLSPLATDGRNLYVGTDSGLYGSTDTGNYWQRIVLADSGQQPEITAIRVLNHDSILVVGSATYMTVDGGKYWENLSNVPILTGNLSMFDGKTFTLEYLGVPYFSTDYGDNWTNISYDLGSTHGITSMTCGNAYVFLGTSSGGVWRLPLSYIDSLLSGVRMSKPPGEFQLAQNYPNPFNPTTTIDYEIPKQERVTLEIYDVLGQKIKTLVEGVLSPGDYSAMWRGTNDAGVHVATGVYFDRLQAGSFVSVKKMLLLK